MEFLPQGKWLALEQKILKIKMGGKSFLELTTYRGIALWWFIRFRLSYHPAESSQPIKSLTKNTHFISFADFLYDFFTSILCKVLLRHSKVKTVRKRQPKVLITAQNVEWKSIRDLTGRLKKGDAFFDSVITELKKLDYDIVTVYPLGYSISGLKTMIDKLKRQKDVTHKAFNFYWSMKIWKKACDARRHFRSIWKNVLEKDEKFIDLLETYGLRTELLYCFNSVFERVVKDIEMAKELVEEEEPDLILLTNEYGIFERALVVAGKLKKIPTLAIQHGNIGPLHKGYMYTKDSISAYGSVETPYCPIPDKTAVYGQYDYDLLTKISAYSSNSVVITGQPRYDILAVANRVYSKEKFCSRLNLEPERKIILVAPEGEAFLRNVLRALKNFPYLQIVVKPHPGEKEEPYKNVVKEENVRAILLSRKAETFEALYACDLLVAGFSTVVTEATILGKPSVTVRLGEREDPTPYHKEVTLRVYRDENLVPAIRKALYDEKTREKLRKAGNKFVSEHVYKQDGKATERVTSLIEEMIKRGNKKKLRS
jgi:hypothetical protein